MLKLLLIQSIIMMTLLMIMHIMMFKKKSNPMTMNPFECGFNNMKNSLPLSIQFSLLIFVFLLFDVELSILISSNWKIKTMDSNWIFMFSAFSLSMIMSIMYELSKNVLTWSKINN